MNDLGLDGQISEAQNELQDTGRTLEQEEEEEQSLLQPARYWFASTAFPLVAGTFGPVASSFNICALAQAWREYIPDQPGFIEDNGYLIPDPKWLIAVNAVSLGVAIIANMALLLNMTGKVSFNIAQPILITGFYLASFLLIGLVGAANSDKFRIEPGSEHALTQAYYYACYAAGIYSFLATLMVVTVWGALTGKYDRKFQITDSQRTLMLQTISFMGYLLIGAAIYSHLEGWEFNDAVYFADFTLLTIGLGDNFVPLTHAGRALVIPYTFGGILAVGLVIGSIRSMLLEKGEEKMYARTTEIKRERIETINDARFGSSFFRWVTCREKKTRRIDDSIPEQDRRRVEFHRMRNIKKHAKRRYQYTSLAISIFDACLLWFIGALVFWYTEYKQDWSYFVAVYFSWTSLLTVGYGDFQPLSNSGKSFFVFWSLLAIPTLTVLTGNMGDTIVKGVSDATNWLGSLTIAPGDEDFFKNLKARISSYSGGRIFKDAKPSRKGGNGELFTTKQSEEEEREGSVRHILFSRLTAEDRKNISLFIQDSRWGSPMARDRAFYQFVLRREIKALIADSKASPPKEYTYDEWAYFLKLLCHDESDVSKHARRFNRPKRDDEPAPQVGRIFAHDGTAKKWSWLGLRSPLLSSKTESDWILSSLVAALGEELNIDPAARPDDRVVPPIRMKDVLSMDKQEEEGEHSRASSSASETQDKTAGMEV